MGILWSIGFIAAVLVVVIVVALLLAILHQASRIPASPGRPKGVMAEILANTRLVWVLGRTNAVAGDLCDGVRLIDNHVVAIGAALAGDADRENAA